MWYTYSCIYDIVYIRVYIQYTYVGFLDGLDDKESDSNAGDLDLVPGSRRSPKEGNNYPLQYSCLEISMDRGAWQVTIHGVTKSQTQLGN